MFSLVYLVDIKDIFRKEEKVMSLQKEAEKILISLSESNETSKAFFVPTTEEQLDSLRELVGDKCYKFIDFYKDYQPNNISFLNSNITLIGIDDVLSENTELAPGVVLSELGIFVFAVTVGGNVVCIDTNENTDGDPAVLLIDHSFIYFDPDDEAEIANIPSYLNEDDFDEEDFELNYENVRKFVYRIEESFVEFIKKYSMNQYDDLEKYL